MAEAVLRELDDDGVLLVTLNRPAKKNAFNDAQWDGLRDALNEAREDPRVAVVVVTGAGNDFSAGAGPHRVRPVVRAARQTATRAGTTAAWRRSSRSTSRCSRLRKGVGVGIGATFLFHCDIVYVGESVRLRLPFVSLGLVPEGASSYLLQQVIGSQRAAELFYTAEWIEAGQAVKLGMAARRVPRRAAARGDARRRRARSRSTPCPRSRPRSARCLRAHRDGIRAAFEAEDAGMKEQAGSPENVEAIRAFLEKRKPDFRQFRRRSDA